MALLKFLRRDEASRPPVGAAADAAADGVQRVREKARRRLIGSAVLLAAGLVLFPLIFQTQPRPLPPDLPVDIPRRDQADPLKIPAPRSLPAQAVAEPAADAPPAATPVQRPAVPASGAAERASPAVPVPPPVEAPVAVGSPSATGSAPAGSGAVVERELPAAEFKRPAATSAPTPAAQTTPSGQTPSGDTTADRFIVQVGAFGEASSAREVRAKVEKLGLKTYTQVVETAEGRRIRVRVGPFASRQEAAEVLARLKAAGLPGAVLTL